jgi:hypothetical protein
MQERQAPRFLRRLIGKRATWGLKALIASSDAAFYVETAAHDKNFAVVDEKQNGFRCCDEGAVHALPEQGKEFVMKKILIATGMLILAAASPASAQLLGGGGGVGGLGGIGGSLGGGFGGMMDSTLGSVRGTNGSTVSGAASSTGRSKVDRRSGSVAVDRRVNANAGGTVGQTLDTPARSATSTISGNASGSATASGNAQLVGTDAVRDAASSARSNVGSTVGAVRNGAANVAQGARDTIGTAANSSSAAVNGTANSGSSAAGGQLALASSVAASASDAVAVQPGMMIQSAKGKAIGQVSQVIADSSGHVQSLLVDVKGRMVNLPAGNFTGQGDALVSAMSAGQIDKVSKSAQGSGNAMASIR